MTDSCESSYTAMLICITERSTCVCCAAQNTLPSGHIDDGDRDIQLTQDYSHLSLYDDRDEITLQDQVQPSECADSCCEEDFEQPIGALKGTHVDTSPDVVDLTCTQPTQRVSQTVGGMCVYACLCVRCYSVHSFC